MVTSELKDGIVWLIVEGDMTAQDVRREAGKWLPRKHVFSGFITDLRRMTTIPATIEQKKLEEWRKQNKSGKPHALLGRTNALGALIKIYVRFTKAADTRYFMDPKAAVTWVRNFGR
ncbi:MAG: hypothetical protein GY832_33930 [Chloroflexi bacterium]|nr:hypothetical protein [Chloroflexota bacterium]